MASKLRALTAVGLMGVGLIALIVRGFGDGWSALAAIGVACLAVAIWAQLVTLRRSRS